MQTNRRLRKRGRHLAILAMMAMPTASAATAADSKDQTEKALQGCLDDPVNASTSGQVNCEAVARESYDRRMNTAYAALLRALPRDVGERLRLAQRAWIQFRDADGGAQAAFFETRQGSMYAPMQAAAQTRAIRDRAIALEAQLRILEIDRSP